MEREVECPYCFKEFKHEEENPCQGETIHIECPECEKYFTASILITLDYTVIDKADCLNGGKHQLIKSIGIPDSAHPVYRCRTCDCHGNIERFDGEYEIIK